MNLAKQSTAKTFLLGPILNSAGVAKTDEVVASIKVTKNGSVGAVDAQDTLTHNHTGHYVFVSDGGDFDTLGEVEFSLNNGTNAMAPVKFQVLPAATYDAIVTNAAGAAGGLPLNNAAGHVLADIIMGVGQGMIPLEALIDSVWVTAVGAAPAAIAGLYKKDWTGVATWNERPRYINANGAVLEFGSAPGDSTYYAILYNGTYWENVSVTGSPIGWFHVDNDVGQATYGVAKAIGLQLPVSGVNDLTAAIQAAAAAALAAYNTTGVAKEASMPATDNISGTLYAKATTYGFMGTLLTGTAALIVAAWQKLFNIATPANTVNDLATAENVTDASSKGEATAEASALASYGDSHWATATQTEATNMPSDGDFLSDEQKAKLTAAAAASGLDAEGVRAALGMAEANLDSQLATLGGNTGSGAYTITVTVNDGTDGIEGARVRCTKGAESYIGTANVSGVVPFGLDAGTWNVAVTAPGYAFTPTTLVVSATAPVTYSMTQVTIPASNPGFVTGYIYCYDQDGVLEEGALVQMRFSDLAGTGHSYDTAIRTAISDAAGVVTFSNLVPGATYLARRGTETDWVAIEISADAEDPVALGNLFGEDS